ncbi:restriction endonuclease subunit S [Bacillus sp. ISL-7]|uniref:restriction endonuclease subunit S n=1 Tax=Bacillus sp. ISL-7 TaxID=2819136 RepID=UPI001BE66E0F|nr:restriction endonuclease subunit S [Bacillus sp. ISL-7]MBT2734601.1 restriction endonuclease subunit S [Bacillus sp. ISL-7]
MAKKKFFSNEWRNVPLEELALLGKRAGVSAKNMLKFTEVYRVTHRHLSKDPYIFGQKCSKEVSINGQERVYQEGTILVSLDRLHRGIGLLRIKATTENRICAIKLKSDKLIPEYLFYYFCWLRGHFPNYKRWNISDFRELMIPLPPLYIQQYIVTLLSKVRELIKKNREAITLIDNYIMALYLSEADQHEGNVNYKKGSLREYATKIEIGVPFRNDDEISSYIPILKKKSDIFLLDSWDKNMKYEVENGGLIRNIPLAEPGDILWYLKNDGPSEEPAAIVHTWNWPISYSNDWVRIRPLSHISAEYLAALLCVEYPQINTIFRSRRLKQMVEHLYRLPVHIPNEVNHRFFTTMARTSNNITKKHRRSLKHLVQLHESLNIEFFEETKFNLERGNSDD